MALKDDIAGDPMNEQVRWTHLTHQQIKQRLSEQSGIGISVQVIGVLPHLVDGLVAVGSVNSD